MGRERPNHSPVKAPPPAATSSLCPKSILHSLLLFHTYLFASLQQVSELTNHLTPLLLRPCCCGSASPLLWCAVPHLNALASGPPNMPTLALRLPSPPPDPSRSSTSERHQTSKQCYAYLQPNSIVCHCFYVLSGNSSGAEPGLTLRR